MQNHLRKMIFWRNKMNHDDIEKLKDPRCQARAYKFRLHQCEKEKTYFIVAYSLFCLILIGILVWAVEYRENKIGDCGINIESFEDPERQLVPQRGCENMHLISDEWIMHDPRQDAFDEQVKIESRILFSKIRLDAPHLDRLSDKQFMDKLEKATGETWERLVYIEMLRKRGVEYKGKSK